ncbi:MAG: aminoacyl-tRNA hydrolase [Gammaproteobacteria bacterium]|nr:aminoacyl-tRNA hydrolase [Gammaproteobacteria bacterium]
MIRVNDDISLPEDELDFSAIRSRGKGGQNVNKVATAIHLRFDIPASSLPGAVKRRLLDSSDRRISSEGVLVIKAQTQRSQDKNREDAVARLCRVIDAASRIPARRIPTRPGRAAKEKRLDSKRKRAQLKKLRSGDYE